MKTFYLNLTGQGGGGRESIMDKLVTDNHCKRFVTINYVLKTNNDITKQLINVT